jgi:hypothetical protein
LLYRALDEAFAAHNGGAKWIVGKQGIGDCVSWGWHHGADICLAVEWKLGQSSTWQESASEAIYGGARVEGAGAAAAAIAMARTAVQPRSGSVAGAFCFASRIRISALT